jgi:hypothetical protein
VGIPNKEVGRKRLLCERIDYMGRAILEIEMPEDCLRCKISDYEQSDSTESLFCPVLEIEIEVYNERHHDCPLKKI